MSHLSDQQKPKVCNFSAGKAVGKQALTKLLGNAKWYNCFIPGSYNM